jgi:ABC-type uncharacterized transport system substrate-binding protein
VTDPVGQGFVASLSHPGGNITGFTDFGTPIVGTSLETQTRITPPVAHVGVIYDDSTAPFAGGILRAIENAASSFGVTARAPTEILIVGVGFVSSATKTTMRPAMTKRVLGRRRQRKSSPAVTTHKRLAKFATEAAI